MTIRASTARKERARERAREDILLAAAEVFARKGYAAATLADLAEAAGFAPPSLYRYFEGKEELYRSLAVHLADEFKATFQAPVDPALPLARRLEALLLAQARLKASRASLLAVISNPAPEVEVTIDGRRIGDQGAPVAFYEEQLRGWLERNVRDGELRLPRPVAARAFAGVAFAFHVRSLEEGGDPTALVPALVELALHGFAGPPAPAGRAGRRGDAP